MSRAELTDDLFADPSQVEESGVSGVSGDEVSIVDVDVRGSSSAASLASASAAASASASAGARMEDASRSPPVSPSATSLSKKPRLSSTPRQTSIRQRLTRKSRRDLGLESGGDGREAVLEMGRLSVAFADQADEVLAAVRSEDEVSTTSQSEMSESFVGALKGAHVWVTSEEDAHVAAADARGVDHQNLFGDVELQPELRTYRTIGGLTTQGMRPSISDLLFGRANTYAHSDGTPLTNITESGDAGAGVEAAREDDDAPEKQFGMWDGICARSLCQIWGVILYLRLTILTGNAGIGWFSVVILVSALIVTLTTLSISAILANGEVQGGGVYVLISRSLGPQFGGAIGLLFAAANAVAIALYLIGFADTLVEQIGDSAPDVRVLGLASLAFIFIMCMIGVSWVVKVQLGLLVLLVASIISVFIGCFANKADAASGFTGVSSERFSENFGPDWSEGDFFFTLGIFFPAMTGIMAGVNIAAEIREPAAKNIAYGTLIAIGMATLTYLGLAWVLGASADRQTGLLDNIFFMVDASIWPPLIYAGIYAATLSSAIASLVGAPRILQAVAKDNLFPVLKPFAKLTRGEPVLGYYLSAAVAAVCIVAGDLNTIAPLITGFFMVSYAAVNFACFFASYSRAPGWRPSFKYYNKWAALVAGVICVVLLVLLSSFMAIAVIVVGAGLYKYLEHSDPDVNWGSAFEASRVWTALKALTKLEKVPVHVKNYRPHILIMTDLPIRRPALVRFSQFLTKSGGAMLYGHVRIASWEDITDPELHKAQLERARMGMSRKSPFQDLGVKVKHAFSKEIIADSFSEGVRALIQLGGISRLNVNCVLFGFMETWHEDSSRCNEYVRAIQDAFMLRCGVMIMRGEQRLLSEEPPYELGGTIDIWWLYDDGGLSILIPHLISRHRSWRKGTRIRIMNVAVNNQLDRNQIEMSKLLHKLRIDAEVVPVDVSVSGKHHEVDSVDENVMQYYGSLRDTPPNRRTRRHLKIAELFRKHSSDATLIVATMPVCMVETPAEEYMSWLDCMTAQPLPPVLLVRGNQETVLTFEM